MAEHGENREPKSESLMEKMADKIHGDHSSSSSDSDTEKKAEKKSPVSSSSTPPAPSTKSKIYRFFGREKPVHNVFGAADVLLWRNKKISASVLGGTTVVWVLFELLGYHLITLVCHVSILTLAILFLWSNASTFINKSPPRIPEVHLSEGQFLEIASALRIEINRALAVLREIASGRDPKSYNCWPVDSVGCGCG